MAEKILIVDIPPTHNPFAWQALYIDGELREESDFITVEDVAKHLGIDFDQFRADEDWIIEIDANGEELPVDASDVKRSRG